MTVLCNCPYWPTKRIFTWQLSLMTPVHTRKLNMELNLQSIFGFHVHRCTYRLRPCNPPPPHTRALLVSQDRRHLFVTDCSCRMWPRRPTCTTPGVRSWWPQSAPTSSPTASSLSTRWPLVSHLKGPKHEMFVAEFFLKKSKLVCIEIGNNMYAWAWYSLFCISSACWTYAWNTNCTFTFRSIRFSLNFKSESQVTKVNFSSSPSVTRLDMYCRESPSTPLYLRVNQLWVPYVTQYLVTANLILHNVIWFTVAHLALFEENILNWPIRPRRSQKGLNKKCSGRTILWPNFGWFWTKRAEKVTNFKKLFSSYYPL